MAKLTCSLSLLVLFMTLKGTLQLGRGKSEVYSSKCPADVKFSPSARKGEAGARCLLNHQGKGRVCGEGLRCCQSGSKTTGNHGLCYGTESLTAAAINPCEPENPCGDGVCQRSDDGGSGYTCQCNVPDYEWCADLKGINSLSLNGADRAEDSTNEYWTDGEEYNLSAFKLNGVRPTEGMDSSSSSIQDNGWYLRPVTSGGGFQIYSPSRICEPAKWCFEFAAKVDNYDLKYMATDGSDAADGFTVAKTFTESSTTEFTVSETLEMVVRCGDRRYFKINGSPTRGSEASATAAIDNVKLYRC